MPLLQRGLDVAQRAAGRAHLDDLDLHPPAPRKVEVEVEEERGHCCGGGRASSAIAIARLLSGALALALAFAAKLFRFSAAGADRGGPAGG